MPEKPASPKAYLDSLPDDRRKALSAIRATIRKNLNPGFKEGIQYGMIGYFVPHSVYPAGYHCDPKQPLPFASIASQKNHIGIYLFCLYSSPGDMARFVEEWRATGKRLDMGKSCVRVKKLEDVPLDVLGRAIKRVTVKKFIASYEKARDETWSPKRAAKKKAAKKAASNKSVKKKATTKKAASKKVTKKKASATGVKKATKKVGKRAASKKVARRR